MIGKKEGKYLIFYLDDGSTVKYDLSTGNQIGTRGKPVKSINHKMKFYSVKEVLDSIDNPTYVKFLDYVWRRCEIMNNCRITSFASILKYAAVYSACETIFSAGIDRIEDPPMYQNDLSPNYIKFCKKYNLPYSAYVSRRYKAGHNFFNLIFSLPYKAITSKMLYTDIMANNYYFEKVSYMVKDLKYNTKSLMLYIDDMIFYEGFSGISKVLDNLYDYANMSLKMSNKFEKYPRYLLSSHQIVAKNYNRFKQEFNEQLFTRQIKPWMEFKNKDYIIKYPQSTCDIKDEAVQQNNCVASYIDRIIEGKCDVVFLRRKDTPDKSLVTVEVKDGKVVQARRAYNSSISTEEKEVLGQYEAFLFSQKNQKQTA